MEHYFGWERMEGDSCAPGSTNPRFDITHIGVRFDSPQHVSNFGASLEDAQMGGFTAAAPSIRVTPSTWVSPTNK